MKINTFIVHIASTDQAYSDARNLEADVVNAISRLQDKALAVRAANISSRTVEYPDPVSAGAVDAIFESDRKWVEVANGEFEKSGV